MKTRLINIGNPDVSKTVLQHHERIGGSGYPNKLTRISNTAQIVGLIDCYESLIKDDRPYRSILAPFENPYRFRKMKLRLANLTEKYLKSLSILLPDLSNDTIKKTC